MNGIGSSCLLSPVSSRFFSPGPVPSRPTEIETALAPWP